MERIDIGETTVEALIAGDGPPLLFLHGSDYFAQHKPFFDRLARYFRVIAPRHPGFGTSRRPPWMRGVGDVTYLYLDLLEQLALDNVLLVGAFRRLAGDGLAVRSTARLGGLVLIDSLGLKFGGRDDVEIADIVALPADEVVRRTFADPKKAPDYGSLDDAAVEEVARDREAAVLYGWRPFMHNPSLRHWLHRIGIPSLVIWGEQDRIVAPSYGAHLTQRLEHARFVPIADAGHYPQVEQPEAVATAIESFARENAR